ncbi:MAG: response regulator [Ignavibacteriales bacterium]|nr:response regulator [Ignavibacteriales bacterium]
MEKILIIDDDESIRESLVNLLSRWKYRTISAENGRQGIDLALSENPDLIISDIRMPKMSRLDVLDELQKLKLAIRVIIITAHDDMSTTIQAMQKGLMILLKNRLKPNGSGYQFSVPLKIRD